MSDTVRKAIGWLITPLYLVLFWSILLVFHPLQMVALLFGYSAHKVVLDLMNLAIITNFRTMGTRFRVRISERIPRDRPLILVSNHQSMYDIPLIIWYLRSIHPKFVAKRELGRGIPSISFALRNMGSVLVDRGNQRQALAAIGEFGELVVQRSHSACIFPEGTRARDGHMKRFKPAGLMMLIKHMPGAVIVPIALNGSWELLRYNFMPVPFGTHLSFEVLDPIETEGRDPRELVSESERVIADALGQIPRAAPDAQLAALD